MNLTLPAALSNKKNALFLKWKNVLTLPVILWIMAFTASAQVPVIATFSPVGGAVGTLVTINGTGLATPTTFTIGGVTALVISNTGTVLTGYVMPGAVTGAISLSTGGGTVTTGVNFTVTPTLFPAVQQGNKLVGTGSTGAPDQGVSVAVSADGNTAIIGGYNDNSGQGAAWVYKRSGTTWAQQGGKLVGTGNTGAANQGWSVSLSADGNTAIVGGKNDNANQGAAWVYTRSGTTWTQQGKLVGTGNTGAASQGWSVSLSADGNTAIVGGQADNANLGAAWVYTRNAGAWTQQGKLVGDGNTGASFQGSAVTLSADGNTALVGGQADNSNVGAVWVFTRTGNTWGQQGSKLVGSGSVGFSSQGCSLSLSADGNTAMVGGETDNGFVGATWVYTRAGTTWTQQGGKLIATDNTGNPQQGMSVSLSADGNTAIIGGFEDNSALGAAWIYTRSTAGAWSQQGAKLVGTGNIGAAEQAYSASLSADGNTAIIGAPHDNSLGAAWVFTAPPPTIASISPSSGAVGTLVTINGSNLSSPAAFTIGGATALVISNTGTVLTGYVMPGAVTGAVSLTTGGGTVSGSANFTVTPTSFPAVQQGNKLVGTDFSGLPNQGSSVAVSADGNTALVGGRGDNSGLGAAWVYIRSGTTWTQQGPKLVGTGSVGTLVAQGASVALSADGNTAIVGATGDNNVGAAWVYTRSGGTWTQQGPKLTGSDATTKAYFGKSVSLSADGNTAIVGAPQDNDDLGAAWIYTRSGGLWTQQGSKLLGSGISGFALQGSSVSLSADGNTAIVGATGANGAGGSLIYARSGAGWTQQGGALSGTGNVGNSIQGLSVSLSADGNTALVGGQADNSQQGAAWVFTRTGTSWIQQGAKLVGTGSTGAANQGTSVSLSADGNTAMVGAFSDNNALGAAWVYTRSGTTWTQQGAKLIGTGYIDPTDGIEQGFAASLSSDGTTALVGGPGDNGGMGAAWVYIVAPPPTIASISPSSGAVGTLVTVTGSNLGTPTAFTIGGVTALVINNTGTVLTGYVMPGAVTGGVSLSTAGGSATIGSNFTVTPTPFPAVQQGNKLAGTGNTGAAHQGRVLAVSADGNTAVVGGYTNNSNQGATWVYTRNAGAWSQQSILIGSGGSAAASQGVSVAISADGNTVITGGYADNNGQGAAWVFTRSGTTWTQQGLKLVGTGSVGSPNQGTAVSLSADGNTAIVGGYADNSGQGAAWVFLRTDTTWAQQGNKLVGAGNISAALQGFSVSLSADGNTAIVGGYADNSNAGAAWVFFRSGAAWAQQGNKLTSVSGTGAQQGYSVSLSADGNTAIVGGYRDNGFQGAAWVYTRSGASWAQQGSKLVGTGSTSPAQQGTCVSLSADGNTAMVGGPFDNSNQGAAWVFTRSGATWSQQGAKLVGTGNTGAAGQGTSVSLSADGTTALVGGVNDDGGLGAAWAYTVPPIDATLSALAVSSGSLSPTFSSTQLSYSVTVPYNISSVTLTPTPANLNATVTVNGQAPANAVTLPAGVTSIPVVVSSPDGVTKLTYVVNVTRPTSVVSINTTGNNPTNAATVNYAVIFADPVTGLTAGNFTLTTAGSVGGAAVGTPTTTDHITWTVPVSGITGSGSVTLNLNNTTGLSPGVTAVLPLAGQTVTIDQTAPTVTISAPSAASTVAGPVSYTVTWADDNLDAGTISLSTANVTVNTTGTAIAGAVDVSAVSANSVTVTLSSITGVGTLGISIPAGTASDLAGNAAPAAGPSATFNVSSSDATLSGLGLTAGILSPAFNTLTTTYTASVANSTTSLTVIAATNFAGATVTVNGSPSPALVNLAVGPNPITVLVTAQDGVTKQTYTITVTRAASSNAGLASLGVSAGALSPVFAAGTGSYTDAVSSATTAITVTPATADPTATITVNGIAVLSGHASGSISLAVGPNTITTIITAGDGATKQTYTITVTRAASNVLLTGLRLNTCSLSPAFSGSIVNYTASVSNTMTTVTVTPTAADATATIKVNGVTVKSGMTSANIPLNVGPNTITILVTGQDGVTTKTYTVVVTRAASANAYLSGLKINGGAVAISPSFNSSTTSYTASVANTISSVTITPTTADATAKVKVNGVAVTSGAASGAIALAVGTNTITTVVTAQNGTTTDTYKVTITRAALSANAYLSGLKINGGAVAISPAFSSATTTYTASVANAIASVTITPTTADATAKVKVNGVAVTSGAASGAITLTVGTNTITTVVTAQNGTTTDTYKVTITRAALSANAYLSGLKINGGAVAISPSFNSSTTSYTASVAYAITSVTITPTTADATAKVKVNGVAVASGAASGAIALAVGTNTITTVVTAQNGTTTDTYKVTVTRAAASTDAYLASLAVSKATLSPSFTAKTIKYTASVTNATTSVTVTPFVADATAAVKVNGKTVASGSPSSAIALVVGANTITTVVTAQNGTTTETYSIVVTRASGALHSLFVPVSVTQQTAAVGIENDGVMVHQGVSPNGDGINDVLTIDGIIQYPDNRLTIIDRSGALVFRAKGYDNISKPFDGHSGITGRMQQPGTYFYTLDYTVNGETKHKTGYILLKY